MPRSAHRYPLPTAEHGDHRGAAATPSLAFELLWNHRACSGRALAGHVAVPTSGCPAKAYSSRLRPRFLQATQLVERTVPMFRTTRAVATRCDKRDYVYRRTIDVAATGI